jgi:hypothetical protein
MSLLSTNHEKGIQRILDIAKNPHVPTATRMKLLRAVDDILKGKREYDERIRELEELVYRNPSFPGDMMGFWDDDKDDDDEDEEENGENH